MWENKIKSRNKEKEKGLNYPRLYASYPINQNKCMDTGMIISLQNRNKVKLL